MEEATIAEKERLLEIKKLAKMAKRDIFIRKQQRDITQLLNQRGNEKSFDDILADMSSTLKNEDIVPMTHLSCNPVWIESYLISLKYHEYALARIQQGHHGVISALSEYIDRRISKKN
jgi:hypothetical protein